MIQIKFLVGLIRFFNSVFFYEIRLSLVKKYNFGKFSNFFEGGDDQIRITKSQLGVSGSRIKDFRKKVEEEFRKPENERITWLDRVVPALNDWLDELFVVNIVCDPVKRLLSDFTHVTDDHGKSSVINCQPSVKSHF